MKDVLNVKCTCTVCGTVERVCIPAPVELENIYENAWKRFLMRRWNRIPKTGGTGYVYFCPYCGGR